MSHGEIIKRYHGSLDIGLADIGLTAVVCLATGRERMFAFFISAPVRV